MSARRAPWLDFKGNPIHEGDVIEHPSGESGIVLWLGAELRVSDRWRVKYESSNELARLCLQVGEKGMATVRQPA